MKLENLKITKILPVEEGTSKAGKAWKKLTFVGETDEQYNNLYAFEIFQRIMGPTRGIAGRSEKPAPRKVLYVCVTMS